MVDRGTETRRTADLSWETVQTGKQWSKASDSPPARACRHSYGFQGEIQMFPDMQMLKDFISSKPVPQEMLRSPSFRLKENDTRWKSGSTGRNKSDQT